MYKGIYDLPVTVYHQIIETNSLAPLFNTKPKHQHAKRIYKCSKGFIGQHVWERMNSQIINEFGVSEEARMIFYKQQDINNLEIKALLGDQSAEFFINSYKDEIERIKKNVTTITDFRKYHARLYRILNAKYQRDPHNLSTFEFYNDLHDLQQEIENKEIQTAING